MRERLAAAISNAAAGPCDELSRAEAASAKPNPDKPELKIED